MAGQQLTQGFVRVPSRSLAGCQLVHMARQALDLDKARQQHTVYVSALRTAGINVTVLQEEPELPDATFVEDTVVVLDEIAVVCRLGRASREVESGLMEREIAGVRALRRIVAPGTMEGGDVLRIGGTLFAGLSSRTNEEGIRQLRECVTPFGYTVRTVGVDGCLHLKTGATSPAEGMLIANDRWIDIEPFREMEILKVPEMEPWGANTLTVNGTVLVVKSSPRCADLLESKGLKVQRVDISELQKAEAGLTCLSVLYSQPA